MGRAASLAAVLFDLDDTLVADEAATEAAFLAACALAQVRHGLEPGGLARAVRDRARELWRGGPTITYCRAIGISSAEGLRARFLGDDPSLAALRAWAPAYRRAAWSGALAGLGVHDDAFAEELARRFVAERGARNRVYPDVIPALTALARAHRLALVTNGAPDVQRAKLAASGLAPHFATVVVSGELGAGKPDPRAFRAALAALGVAPERAIMVGDSPERDVVGAQAAGLRAILLDRAGRVPAGERGTAPVIRDLRQLLDML